MSGGSHWGGGIAIHAEDQARIGLLMLRRGVWDGQRLLPESWIDELLKPCTLHPNYGLLWWLNTGRARYPSASDASFFASGAGGNITWVDPTNDLVAVMRWMDPAAVDGFIRLVISGCFNRALEPMLAGFGSPGTRPHHGGRRPAIHVVAAVQGKTWMPTFVGITMKRHRGSRDWAVVP